MNYVGRLNKNNLGHRFNQAVLGVALIVGLLGGGLWSNYAQATAGIYKTFQYQARITNNAGTPLADSTYDFRFQLCASSDCAGGGDPLWTETHNGVSAPEVTITSGVMTVDLGATTTLGSVNFNDDSIYLEVAFDTEENGSFEEVFSPRRRLTAAPYAFNAEKLGGKAETALATLAEDETITGAYSFTKVGTALSVTNTASLGTLNLTNALGTLYGGTGATSLTNLFELNTHTTGNYVASANTSALTGLTGGSAGSEGAALTIAFDYSQALSGDPALGANAGVFGQSGLVFEGATANLLESFISITDPTVDRTFTLPDRSGTVSLSGDTFTGDVTGTLNASGATALTIAADAVALTTDTTGNYVASVATTAPLSGGAAGSEGATLTLAITADGIGDTELAFNTGQTLTTAGTPQFARLGLGAAADATNILTVTSTSTTDLSKALNASHTGAITGTGYAGYFSKTGTSTTNVGLYATASGATNNYAAIFNAGNVGIGTATPVYPLHIYKTSGNADLIIETDSAGSAELLLEGYRIADNIVGKLLFYNTGNDVAAIDVYRIGADSAAEMRFSTQASGGALTQQMVISSIGNIGIGTATPASKLDVTGNALITYSTASAYGLTVNNSSATGYAARFQVGGTSVLTIGDPVITASIPLSVTAAGDTGIAYDLILTNIESANIKSQGPLYITAGDPNHNEDLVFNASGSGDVIVSSLNNFLVPGGFICADNGDTSPCSDRSAGYTSGTVYGDASSFAAGDIAELYGTNDSTLSKGEVVVFDQNISKYVARSGPSQKFGLAGIVSTQPGVLIGDNTAGLTNYVPVALSGRVPTKVTLENGPIAIGDPLTSSSTPGVAMKATESGMIVGFALESFGEEVRSQNSEVSIETEPETKTDAGDLPTSDSLILNSASQTGTVLAFVNVIYYVPLVELASVEEAAEEAGEFGLVGLVKKAAKPHLLALAQSVSELFELVGVKVSELGHLVFGKAEVGELAIGKPASAEESATIGTGLIPMGQSHTLVANTKVHPSSRIFLTFRGDTAGRWWVSHVAEGEFEIKVSEVVLNDTYFDYWIVQTDITPPAQAPNPNIQIPSANNQDGGDIPDTDATSEPAVEPIGEVGSQNPEVSNDNADDLPTSDSLILNSDQETPEPIVEPIGEVGSQNPEVSNDNADDLPTSDSLILNSDQAAPEPTEPTLSSQPLVPDTTEPAPDDNLDI